MKFEHLTLEEVLILHESLIKGFGGLNGLRDAGALESALIRPRLGYYESVEEQAAALIESLANNGPFIDGNKRIAFFAADTFLRLNGFYLEADPEKAYNCWMQLFDEKRFQFDQILQWIKQSIRDIE